MGLPFLPSTHWCLSLSLSHTHRHTHTHIHAHHTSIQALLPAPLMPSGRLEGNLLDWSTIHTHGCLFCVLSSTSLSWNPKDSSLPHPHRSKLCGSGTGHWAQPSIKLLPVCLLVFPPSLHGKGTLTRLASI